MGIEVVRVGFDNFLAINRVIAVASVNSGLIRRTMQEAKSKGLLVDMTHGRKAKAVIFTDSERIFLSALASETISRRLQAERGGIVLPPVQSDEEDEL